MFDLMKNVNRSGQAIIDMDKLVVYDRVESANFSGAGLQKLWKSLNAFENKAYVFGGEETVDTLGNNPVSPQFEIISQESKNFQLIHFDFNQLKFKISYPRRKFLVYHDSLKEALN